MECMQRLEAYLRENKVPFQMQHHARAYTAQEVAASEHVSGRLVAKTVFAFADGKMVMAVLPAHHVLDLASLKSALGAKDVRLAEEAEFSAAVPNENDRYIRTFRQEVDLAGGLDHFWDLAKLAGLQTPFLRLSRALGGGMRNGEVYVIGANQGAGKTSLALQFITHLLYRHVGVLFFSMEMDWRAVFQRMAAIEAECNLNEYREAQIIRLSKKASELDKAEAAHREAEMVSRLSQATARLVGLPLLVSTKPSVTPEYISQEAARLKKQHPIQLVVVDHMQLMSSAGGQRSDYEKFTAISRQMKQTAMDMGVPLLLVSQTSRGNAKEHRGELDVSDLRGSGAIEEDAAAVMLLYEDKDDRDRALLDGTYPSGPVKSWLKLGKNRYGEQGKYLELKHYKTYTKFAESHTGPEAA